jgi:hypothetical protein
MFKVLALACLIIAGLSCVSADDSAAATPAARHIPEYIHEWAAKVSDPLEADLIAIETGFVNHGPIKPFHDIYLFKNNDVPRRSKRHAKIHTDRLEGHEKVLWAEQQVSKLRTKRDHQQVEEEEGEEQRRKRNLDNVLKFDKRAEATAYRSTNYDDPQWSDQWYLVSFEKNIKSGLLTCSIRKSTFFWILD